MTQTLLQLDLATPARLVIATLARALPPRPRVPRRLCPIVVSGEPEEPTADINTLVVDGIKNTERLQS